MTGVFVFVLIRAILSPRGRFRAAYISGGDGLKEAWRDGLACNRTIYHGPLPFSLLDLAAAPIRRGFVPEMALSCHFVQGENAGQANENDSLASRINLPQP